MRILVLTQKVDREDPILGFFHNWIIKLSTKFENVIVICLGKGVYNLPSNVQVYSLGKESGGNKLKYIFKFFHLCFFSSLKYDSVFVHMNEEYVLLGWKFWKFWGKKIYMWRNHKKGSLHTRFAVLVSTKVFYTSPDSFTAQFKKAIKMPVGIDVERFKDLKIERRKNSILFIGRIAPVKRVELFVEALKILEDKGISFEASIYGDALEKDKGYFDDIKKKAEGPELVERINFQSGVPNYKTPEIYSKNQIYINLTPSGSFDKTILEASACGCIPVIINGSLEGVFDDNMIASDKAEDIANKIQYWLEADESIKQEWRVKLFNYVLENHSLNALMERLCIIIRK